MSKRTFDALMRSYPRCVRKSRAGTPKRAIPPDAAVEELAGYLRSAGYPDTHWYWCPAAGLPRHMHLTTTVYRGVVPREQTEPMNGDRT